MTTEIKFTLIVSAIILNFIIGALISHSLMGTRYGLGNYLFGIKNEKSELIALLKVFLWEIFFPIHWIKAYISKEPQL